MRKYPKKYVRLFSTCIPVKGVVRSLIVDTQRKALFHIPNDLYDIILDNFDKPLDDLYGLFDLENHLIIDEYIEFLNSKELVFYTDDPSYFPTVDLAWSSPLKVTNAIIDLNQHSNYNFEAAVLQLDLLGTEALQIRIYTRYHYSYVIMLLKTIQQITKRLRVVQLVLTFDESLCDKEFTEALDNIPMLNSIVIHSCPFEKTNKNSLYTIDFVKDIIRDEGSCGCISPGYFTPHLSHVSEASAFNTCLNRKISIDVNGKVKNCPSMKTEFGNIDNVELDDIIEMDSFKSIWSISKSQVNVCKVCEYRLVCTDCRAYLENLYDKPKKCKYDPYIGKWLD
jgi:SPASM domain peptide maturase of grasp-with-spasm system